MYININMCVHMNGVHMSICAHAWGGQSWTLGILAIILHLMYFGRVS